MRRVAAVGIDDNFPARQAAIAVGTADHEIPGRVHQKVRGPLRHPALRQGGLHRGGDLSLTMPGVYFLALRFFSLCWVETTTLVQPTGLP